MVLKSVILAIQEVEIRKIVAKSYNTPSQPINLAMVVPTVISGM
jgi:hypothetical protein